MRTLALTFTAVLLAASAQAAPVMPIPAPVGAKVWVEQVGCNQYGCWGGHSLDGGFHRYNGYGDGIPGHNSCVYGRGC